MSSKRRVTIAILAALAGSGCGAPPKPLTPQDAFRLTALAPLPADALAGSSVLLLPVGDLVLTDSAGVSPALAARAWSLRGVAEAALDSALKARAPGVVWLGLAEQQRALRMAPALGIEPARLDTRYLLDPRITSMVDPLWSQLRALMGLTNARAALAPAGVLLDRRGTEYTAEYVLVLVDPRDGSVVGRGRTVGPAAATPEAALAAAALATVPSTVH